MMMEATADGNGDGGADSGKVSKGRPTVRSWHTRQQQAAGSEQLATRSGGAVSLGGGMLARPARRPLVSNAAHLLIDRAC
jgi:hypothetical protein